jgi:hypothetical protein
LIRFMSPSATGPGKATAIRILTYNFRLGFTPGTELTADNPAGLRKGRTLQKIFDRSEPDQFVPRLLDRRDADYSEPASGRPEWHLRRELRCHSRGHRRNFSGDGVPCRRLPPLEFLDRVFWSARCRRISPRYLNSKISTLDPVIVEQCF